MTVATVTSTRPLRHGLVMPDCDCGMCGPTWARRRGRSKRFTDTVTLVSALEAEEAVCWPTMVEQHRQCLSRMADDVVGLLSAPPAEHLGLSVVGLTLVMFAGELASAVCPQELRAELPAGLLTDCEQAVTAATLLAARCMAGLVETMQVFSGLVG
jgi:hypothetical protein